MYPAACIERLFPAKRPRFADLGTADRPNDMQASRAPGHRDAIGLDDKPTGSTLPTSVRRRIALGL